MAFSIYKIIDGVSWLDDKTNPLMRLGDLTAGKNNKLIADAIADRQTNEVNAFDSELKKQQNLKDQEKAKAKKTIYIILASVVLILIMYIIFKKR